MPFNELISKLNDKNIPEGYFCKDIGVADIRYATRQNGEREAEDFICSLLEKKKTIVLNQLALVFLGLLKDGHYENEQKFKKLYTDGKCSLYEVKLKSQMDGTYRLYCGKKVRDRRTEFVLTHGDKKLDSRKGQQHQIERALLILNEDMEAKK